MSSTLTLPTVIAALLPLLATALSSWLNDDHLPAGVNALISLIAILITAVACELLSASIPLTWPLRLVAVLGYIGVLMNGDLATLYTYLVAKPSPVTPKPPTPTSMQTVTTRAYTPPDPTPIVPPQSPLVPPRASAQSGEQPKTGA